MTCALRLPTPGWSLVLGDYRNLIHSVERGSGLRFSIVLANHRTTTDGLDGFDREVWARKTEEELAELEAEFELVEEMDEAELLDEEPRPRKRTRSAVG